MLFILTPCKVKVCLIGKEYRNFGPLSWKTVIQIYLFPLFKAKTNLLRSICQGVSRWGIPASWLGIFKYLLLYDGQSLCRGTPQAEPSRLRGWGHCDGRRSAAGVQVKCPDAISPSTLFMKFLTTVSADLWHMKSHKTCCCMTDFICIMLGPFQNIFAHSISIDFYNLWDS